MPVSSPDALARAPAAEPAPDTTRSGDLFISYSRRDRGFTERLAVSLSALGWSVWWDHRIGAGDAFDRTIEDAIAAARLVLVVWSRHSVASDWVRAEAAFALAANKLLPLSIDSTAPPLRYTHIHRLDMSSWDGSESDPGFRRLVSDIAVRLGVPVPAPDPIATVEPDVAGSAAPVSRRFGRGSALTTVIGAIAVGAFVLAWIERPSKGPAMIGSPVPFVEGQVTLSSSARASIDRQATYLKDHPEFSATVRGYCTPREGERFGPGVLAELRANKVRNELVGRDAVPAGRILTAGAAKACDARAGLAVLLRN